MDTLGYRNNTLGRPLEMSYFFFIKSGTNSWDLASHLVKSSEVSLVAPYAILEGSLTGFAIGSKKLTVVSPFREVTEYES